MPTGDVVNSRFEQSLALHGSKPVANLSAEEEYLFYVCTDPHISSTTNNLRRFVGDFRSDPEALFGIVLGDCIDSLGHFFTLGQPRPLLLAVARLPRFGGSLTLLV